jgi:hypothetical protein
MKTRWIEILNLLKTLALLATVGLAIQMADGQCLAPPSGLVGWWPGDGNPNDISGNNLNGVLMNGTSFVPGVVDEAFNFDGTSNYVQVGTSDSLNLAIGQARTIEGWIRPTTNIYMIILHKGNESGTTYDLNEQYWDFAFRGDLTNMCLALEIGGNGGQLVSLSSVTGIIPGQWSHVAVVITSMGGPSDNYSFYINGTNAGIQVTLNQNPISITTSEPLRIGVGKDYYGNLGSFFQGQMDEMAIYNRALSASEIAAIYSAGSAGKCKPLMITTQPQNQTGYLGGSATFSVSATSISPPVNYQWQQNGIPISNATNATLVLTNLQPTNASCYTVVVTDSADNAATSSPANLTLSVAGVNIALYAGVTINGVVGQTYGIQSLTNLGNPNIWIGRTNITLSTPTFLWQDTQPTTTQPQGYYRVVLGPISIP